MLQRFADMKDTALKRLVGLIALYALASLVHFIHNAEFLTDYPNLPDSWTRLGVYGAWLGMTGLGAAGLWLALRGFRKIGLGMTVIYAVLGMDSIAHYLVAPFSAHTAAMNATILFEVGAATLVLIEAVRLLFSNRGPAPSAPV